MSRRILISGASIAGTSAAWWLSKEGFDVTVVEQWPQFRTGGQNIDVRDVGRDVLQRMGLDQEALAHGTKEEGTAWVDENGAVAAQFVTDELGADGPTAELEILRGDLSELLYRSAKDRCAFKFGHSITGVEERGDGLAVTFKSGDVDKFDALIVAEGVGSSTRDLLFRGENNARWMDLTIAYFTIPRVADDDRTWRWYNATNGRSISLRPDTHGTTRAMLSIRKTPEDEHHWDRERQSAFLHEQFHDAGWQAARVLAGLDQADDYYFDVLRQVRLPHWSKGRVVLTGDAAWCATPMAGIGATLAITGAYVLAGEMSRNDDFGAAFAAYEAAMRPMVEQGQNVPKFSMRMMNPKSRLGINLLHKALHVASSPAVKKLAGTAFSRKVTQPDIDRYAGL